jgi:SAM-dependent methyltransferase
MPKEIVYIGNELTLFKEAKNWKKYYAKKLQPFIKGNVLDVGSGLGINYEYLKNAEVQSWTFLEPDNTLLSNTPKYENSKKINGTLSALNSESKFDTIIYIDVLEHIKNDKEEVLNASNKLAKEGHLIILCPAHNSLYSPFDKAIGHYKRYNKDDATRLSTEGLMKISAKYYDSMSIPLSFANKYILKQPYPSKQQINFWDKFIVPISKLTDWLCAYTIGKTIIIIFQKK